MFTIDGQQWPLPCKISRVSEMKSSEISGLLLDGSYFNDVLGQFLRYDVKIAVPVNALDSYGSLYELLTQPVDGHTFVLPYNKTTVTITGRVESVSDECVRFTNGYYWKDISFTIAANNPTKALTLSEVITRGRTPMPNIITPSEGDYYYWHDGEWTQSSPYPDADLIEY